MYLLAVYQDTAQPFMLKKIYSIKLDASFKASSLESMSVLLHAGSFTFHFAVIYRVPPSRKNKLQKSAHVLGFLVSCHLAPFITEIVNKSYLSGIFPPSLKSAIVQLLIKKSTLNLEIFNYRPVSNLPFISKVSEKVISV